MPILAGACQGQFATPPSALTEPTPGTAKFSKPTGEPESAPSESIEPFQQNPCPDLDSRLFQLTQVANPLELAQKWQMRVKNDKVQVLLVVDGEDTTFLQNFNVDLGTQIGSKVQLFAPVSQLCALANTPQVVVIRPPTQVFIQ